MKAIDSIPNTDRLNYLNIGLLLLACGVAFFVPFELFLFSYAVLGPLHYFTEISWLHERKYFTKERFDFFFLCLACVILFMLIYVVPRWNLLGETGNASLSSALLFIGAAASVGMVLLKSVFHRFLAFLVICVGVFFSRNAVLLFAVFVPTLVHVYIFTGLFMLYGALKGRSKSGYLACLLFAVIPFLFLFVHPASPAPTSYTLSHYPMFRELNVTVMKLFDINPSDGDNNLYYSQAGLTIMRFIAFAYTYHYLNWFSKTSVIGWHRISKRRMAIILVLWIAAVALYWSKFETGFYVLLLVSFLHVFLEFPLNRVTFTGIFREMRSMLRG